MKSLSWRIVVSLLVLLASIVYVLPSLPGVGGSSLGNLLPDARISLGLDLKGGMHLTLGVEVDKAVSNSLSLTGQELRAQASEKGITVLRSRLTPDNRLEFLLPRAEQRTELQELLSKDFPQLAVDSPTQVEGGGLRFTAAFTPAAKAKIEEMALDQAVRTIRNRIDQFGVAEPDIRKQADFRIQIQLPGLTDSKRAIQLVGQTAQLTFHLVRDDVNPQGILPPGVALFPMVTVRPDGSTSESMIALDKEPLMTGEDVADARPTLTTATTSRASGFPSTRAARPCSSASPASTSISVWPSCLTARCTAPPPSRAASAAARPASPAVSRPPRRRTLPSCCVLARFPRP